MIEFNPEQNQADEYRALSNAINENTNAPDEYHVEVRFMNRFMNFCSLEPTPEIVPTDEEDQKDDEFSTSLKFWTSDCLAIESKTI